MRTKNVKAAAERDEMAGMLGAICVAATVRPWETVRLPDGAACDAVRSILAERDQLHSWHEDEKNWRIEAEKERDAIQFAVGALAHHVGVWDGDDSRDAYVEALGAVRRKYDDVVAERDKARRERDRLPHVLGVERDEGIRTLRAQRGEYASKMLQVRRSLWALFDPIAVDVVASDTPQDAERKALDELERQALAGELSVGQIVAMVETLRAINTVTP